MRQTDRPVGPVATLGTSELRWFVDGMPSDEVLSWFTDDGRHGEVEVRRDLYLVDGRPDVGVKLRGRSTLELKVRRSVRGAWNSSAGPGGRIELWHRWSPADALVDVPADQPWIDVRKRIVRRRFTADGQAVVLGAGERSMAGAGCDVEVTAIELAGKAAWSLAFAAFGPLGGRRASIAAAWRALGPATAPLVELVVSCGYPEWLAARVGSAGIVRMEPEEAT